MGIQHQIRRKADVAADPVTNSVTNKPPQQAQSDKARVARWRAANRERYNASQRELMRRRRAADAGQ